MERWHTAPTEKVDQVHHSGIKQVHHTTTIITKKRLLMVSGDLVEVMVTIHRMVLHTIIVAAVQVALSYTIIPKFYGISSISSRSIWTSN